MQQLLKRMRRVDYNQQFIRCVVVAVKWIIVPVIFFLLVYFIPESTCRDGWESPSIGRQGACSYHGGVVNPLEVIFNYILIGCLTTFILFIILKIVRRNRSNGGAILFPDCRAVMVLKTAKRGPNL